jgi:hypothetical protein
MNIGHSSRLPYDNKAYTDKLRESVSPGDYRLDQNYNHNNKGCLHTLGPRGTDGVSTLVGHTVAPSQKLVDFESMLSNRNVKASRAKSGRVNHVDLKKYKLQHHPVCNDYLDSQYTRLTYPAEMYRGAPINRFYNLPHDPQANIFYDFAVNTSLEAKDNYVPEVTQPMKRGKYPNPVPGKNAGCVMMCDHDGACSASCRKNNKRNARNGRRN